jgi:hypothetical protein
MSALPAHVYYRACAGAWRAPISLVITDPAALAASTMAWADRVSLRLMAAWPRWLGTFWMETTVAYDPAGVVAHTTVVRWLGLPLMVSAETITLAPDGQRFTLTGAQRVGCMLGRPVTGEGSVGPDGATARYVLQWLGVTVEQTTVREANRVTLTQVGPGFSGVQGLVREKRPARGS